MAKKTLFISSSNLTTNPRLLKELKLAVLLGYDVSFIGFFLGNWSDNLDSDITKNINANFNYISVTRKPILKWFISSIFEKIAKKIYPYFKNNIKINAYAHSKRTLLLNQFLRKNKNKYDLIIAHTLQTLYPAYKLTKRTNTKFIFDIEDYHPGETIFSDNKNEKARRIFLLKELFPKASFITYASPLIGEYSLKLLDNYPQNQHLLINNCFSQSEFNFKENKSKKIKFVWFSQNISQGRGLELVIPALAEFKEKLELHLIGNLYSEFYNSFLSEYSSFIKTHKPLKQKELNLKLSEFDIGLAVELNNADFNRQICLTNKIWAYTQSGLYVLATNTKAQTKFIEEHKIIGTISEQNVDSFKHAIKKIINNITEIRSNKQFRFDYASQLSWEVENKKLIKIWENIKKQ